MRNRLFISHLYRNKDGFTAVEFVIGFAILSMVVTFLFSILNFTTKASAIGEEMDEILVSGRYAIEYIKDEVRKADKIIASDKIEELNSLYPKNIGFVIFIDNKKEVPDVDEAERYKFITYYLKNNKLVRLAINKADDIYPRANNLGGYNEICSGVLSLEETRVEKDEKLIYLNLTMGFEKELHNFKSCIFLESDFDF